MQPIKMHAYILTTTKPQTIAQKVIKLAKFKITRDKFFSHPDVIVVKPEPSITISQARNLKNRLARKPLKLDFQAAIIVEAQKMTLPAQNAFLKILEEPNPYTLLFLATVNPYQLLPTILSRCQIISFGREKGEKEQPEQLIEVSFLKKLLQAGIGKRLNLIEPYSIKRDEALNFSSSVLNLLERELLSPKSNFKKSDLYKILKLALKLNRSLEQNLNLKLSLDHWALSL